MSTVTIEISDLRGIDSESVKDLAEFLENRVGAKVNVSRSDITLDLEDLKKIPSRAHLRVLLRKFLHQEELKDDLRVISGKENTFIIKEKGEQ